MPLSPIREITSVPVSPIGVVKRRSDESVFPTLDHGVNLAFPGTVTQHATHSLHTYVAAINPPLASTLIKHYTRKGELILDPFCGGGGVLVEAALHGRSAIGCDINPLAVLMSRAKTTHIPSAQALKCYLQVENEAHALAKTVSSNDVPDVIRFWYLDETLAPLRALGSVIAKIDGEKLRDLFLTVLSATARDVMLTYRGEVRLRRLRDAELERFRPNVFAAFKRRALAAIQNVAELPRDNDISVRLLDARKLSSAERCHTVITSPPYGDDKNGIGYFQFSRNMLYWIGVPLEDQKRQKASFLGSCTPHTGESLLASATLKHTVEIIRERSANHYREALSFYADYHEALCSITARTDERVIIVIGDRVLSRTRIHNEHITTEFLNELGWPLEHYYTRELKKKRIANLGGDGGGISTEHILIYRRPSRNRVRKDCQAAAMSRTSTSGCSPVNGNE